MGDSAIGLDFLLVMRLIRFLPLAALAGLLRAVEKNGDIEMNENK